VGDGGPSLLIASPADLGAIERLLVAAGLDPPAGSAGFIVAAQGGVVIGCISIVQVDGFAVLRSMAVAPRHRGRGVGAALLRAAVECARRRRVIACYLRTLSAENFYRRNGWSPCPQAAVPDSVRTTPAWRLAHPQSSGMCLVLECPHEPSS
jgi:amino-acid N-acetyltransferase